MKKKILNIIIELIIMIIILEAFSLQVFAASDTYNQKIISAQQVRKNGINNFPESYQILLNKLVEKNGYTNWKFKAFYTDIDWNELVENESTHMKNTIIKNSETSYPESWYCSCGQEGDKDYYCASKEIIEYYLDPRNFLTNITIFQFLDLSNSSNVSVNQIENIVQGTYLDGKTDTGVRYAQAIKDAADASGESAYSIVIRIFQELGKTKTKPKQISGQDEDYPNVYNFYNYGANDGEDNIKSALAYAKSHGWTNEYKAIVDGAKLASTSYLKRGQNTKYLYKFDVVGSTKSDLYEMQYMTNVEDPNSQAQQLQSVYSEKGLLNNELTFIIPIYKNMPAYKKLPSTQTGNLYYVSSNYSKVGFRSEPSVTTGSRIKQLRKDTIVNVLQTGINNGWAKIEVDGQTGYISEEYITKVNIKKDTYKVPTDTELPFEDVDRDEWYYSAIEYAYNKKFISGTSATTFSPEMKLTRGMLVTILYKMEGSPKVTAVSKFSDVQNTKEYYYKAVNWAAANNIVSGYSDSKNKGKFGPDDKITREQLAVILWKYSKYKGTYKNVTADYNKFSDSQNISDFAKKGMNWAVGVGVITGSQGKLLPQGSASRAEAVSMIYKYCTKVK